MLSRETIDYRWFDTLLNITFILLPMLFMPTIAAIEISDATSAYSIAVAPDWHRRIFINRCMAHSLVNNLAPERAAIGPFCSWRACEMLEEDG
jgi:hypothetical protein